MDTANHASSAIAIDHGRILNLGDALSILAQFNGNNEIIDLGGLTVLPGLIDSHIHLEHFALSLDKVDCETNSLGECLQRVKEHVSKTPPGEWIQGHGWNQNEWGDHQSFPSTNDLDAVAPHHPIYLTAKSLHVAWVNSAALSAAGISTHSSDPPGGRLGRSLDGKPDGILFEQAMTLVSSSIPDASEERRYHAIQSVQNLLWSMGITSVYDFDRRQCFQTLQMLHANHDLKLRVIKSIPLEDLDHAIAIGLRTGFGDDILRIGAIKAFSDGALGARTAAMLSPYQGEPQNRGMLLLDAEEIFEHGHKAIKNGLSMAVHAIGDRANHETLNAFAQMRLLENHLASNSSIKSSRHLRHRIEHVQIIHPHDALRLRQLGVIASMQPIHATSDYPTADRFWGKRSANAYAWRALLDLGIPLAFGSDAPVESPNPFWGLHAAVTRQRHSGAPGPDGWFPQQRLTLMEALTAYTSGAAYAANMEDRLGKLAPGYLADLIILDDDPFQIDPQDLYNLQPVGTMVNGEWVLRSFE